MGRSKEFEENEVLSKAMEIFWQKGYEKTSMSELVEHMGIHRKSIYDTFGDKHELYLRAMDFYDAQSEAKLRGEVSRAGSSYEAIQNIFNYMIEGSEDMQYGCFFVNATTELGAWDQEVLERTEASFLHLETVLTDIVKAGQEQGTFSKKYDSELIGEVLHNTLLGLRVLVKTSAGKDKMKRIAQFFLDLLKE